MLGNAVPSLLAEVLAREIRRQLLGSSMEGPLELMPKRRPSMSSPEPLLPVPTKYHDMIGDHADHPGTSKSVKAQERVKRMSPQLIAAE